MVATQSCNASFSMVDVVHAYFPQNAERCCVLSCHQNLAYILPCRQAWDTNPVTTGDMLRKRTYASRVGILCTTGSAVSLIETDVTFMAHMQIQRHPPEQVRGAGG